jgi:hypothetical protein
MKQETVTEVRQNLKDIESLSDTPFSGLFHAARTAKSCYSGVTIQVRIEDGAIETSEPVKIRQGQHLRGTDEYDGMIHLPVKSFMRTETARNEISSQLKRLAR